MAKHRDVCSIMLSTLPSEHEAGIRQNQTGDHVWPIVLMEDLTVWPWASHLTSLTFTPHCGLGPLDIGDFSRCHFKSSHAHSTLCSQPSVPLCAAAMMAKGGFPRSLSCQISPREQTDTKTWVENLGNSVQTYKKSLSNQLYHSCPLGQVKQHPGHAGV